MDELLEQFLIEGRDLVAEAHRSLIALESDADDRQALDSLFRAAHTLKGSVAIFDMTPAETLLHAAESRLELARKGDEAIDGATLDALVAIIDQTDRWIDAMEHTNGLDEGAQATAIRLASLFENNDGDPADMARAPALSLEASAASWLEALQSRQEFGDSLATARTAFRYAPDADCFFRGEDPLAFAAGVPDLVALAISPADGDWPSLADWEPFCCAAVIEGLSGADIETVRAAFRMVAGQVEYAALADLSNDDRPSDLPRSVEAGATLRIEAAKLDRLADQSGELGVAIRALGDLVEEVRSADGAITSKLRSVHEDIERIANALQQSVAQVRLVPLEPILRRLPRLARETAASLEKLLRFTLVGESTQVDKQIADQLFEPLLHLVRNAIDHGIEAPRDRAALGKAAEGILRLSAAQEGDMIVLRLSDDGCGIDPAKIRDAALAKGLIDRDEAEKLNDAEAQNLIFLPGFSTSAQASHLSGRGVGMDAVKASVERLGGTVLIQSKVGEGTEIELRFPANAITTPLLIVEAGDQRLGLRLDHVVEITRIAATSIHEVGRGRACVLRDATVPVLDLGVLLGLGEAEGEQARLVVVDPGSGDAALRVARFGERFDAVVRETAGLLAQLPAVAGTATMPDGSVLLVLDLAELVA